MRAAAYLKVLSKRPACGRRMRCMSWAARSGRWCLRDAA